MLLSNLKKLHGLYFHSDIILPKNIRICSISEDLLNKIISNTEQLKLTKCNREVCQLHIASYQPLIQPVKF